MGNSRKLRALESVIGIGEKYGKTAGQILIKFQVQRQIAVIPKDRFQYKTLYFSFKMGFRLEKIPVLGENDHNEDGKTF